MSHLNNFIEHTKKGGWRGGRWWLLKQYHRNKPGSLEGTNVFEREWELLIIIDGCDPSWIRDISGRHEFVDQGQIGEITSVGTASFDWHERTFGGVDSEILKQTAVISANPFVSDRTPDTLGMLDDVGEWGWEEELGTVPAHKVTDAAIEAGRTTDYDRFLVHYMQPHAPFLKRTDPDKREAVKLAYDITHCWSVWYEAMRGELSQGELKSLYVDNLRYVLNEVAVLCENFDVDGVILSADHGNAVGQRGMYGHPGRAKIEWLRRVPWVSLTASDKHTIEPTLDREAESASREKQLEALGYR